MASPVFGYSTLQIIPSLDGASAILDRELGRILSRVGDDAGQEAGERIAKGIAASDSEVAASTRQLADAASRGAGQSGEEIGREIGKGVGNGLDSSTGDLGSGLTDKLRSEGADMAAVGERIGREGAEGVESGLESGQLGQGLADKLRTSTDLPAAGRGLGESTGTEVGAGMLDGFPDLSGGLEGVLSGALGGLPAGVAGPALAAGAAVGALVVQGIGDSLEKGRIVSKLQAGLGASEGEAARLGQLAGDIYASNFGDSVGDVGDAVASVRRNFAGLGSVSQAELAKITRAALTTASVFDEDVNGAVRAASQLLRTGLARDSQQAFDIITKGLQGPANKAQDLLDTFNEYSTQFRELGLDGEEALGLIQQGVQAGARDADLAADTLKEFAIRAQDASTTSIEGFEALGLSWEEMQAAIAGGGEGAAQALDTVLDRLRGIEDPAERAQIAVKLFGTQSEDMQDALNAMDLSTAVSELGRVEGAAQDAQDAFDDTASNFTVVRREIEQQFEGLGDQILEPVAAALRGDWLDGAATYVEDFVKVSILGPFGLIAPDLYQDGQESGASFREGLESGLGIETGRALAEVTASNRDMWGNIEIGIDSYRVSALDAGGATAVLIDEMKALEDRAKPVGSALEIAALGAESFRNSLKMDGEFETMLSTALSVSDVFRNIDEELESLGNIDLSDVAAGLEFPEEDAAAALGNILGMADALQERIASVFEFQGADAAVAEADSLRESLARVAREAGLSSEQIAELIDAVNLSEADIDLAVKVSGIDIAIAQLQVLYSMVGGELGQAEFNQLEAYIGLKVQEEDFTAARDLVTAFQQDMVDGSLDNPILLAINGDTTPAKEAEQELRTSIAEGAPVDIPLGANTAPATESYDLWRLGAAGAQTDTNLGANTDPAREQLYQLEIDWMGRTRVVAVDADVTKAKKTIDEMFRSQRILEVAIGGSLAGNQSGLPRRAGGGPVMAGQAYVVGEREAEVFVPGQSGMILNQAQLASLGVGGKQRKDLNIHVTSDSADGRRIGLQVADYLWLRDN